MRAKEIRKRSDQDLADLEARLARELFEARFQNLTNRLDKTSKLRDLRRDLARVKTIRRERALGIQRHLPADAPPAETKESS